LDAELALAHAMVEHRRPVPGTGDALAALGTRRTGSDLAGWLREVQRLEQLIDHRDWVQARGEVADLRARIRRFPAPLLRAHVALAQVRLHLALCEYRRADEIAAAAVEERLPLHVPRGGAGLALLAQVALVRGRAAEADGWLADVGELAQERFGEPTAALDEALGLRARLADDVAAATDHYRRAVRAGSVLPSTVLDLVHMRWRTGVGDEELTAYLTARGAGGDPAFTAAAAPVRAPVTGTRSSRRTRRSCWSSRPTPPRRTTTGWTCSGAPGTSTPPPAPSGAPPPRRASSPGSSAPLLRRRSTSAASPTTS